MTLFLFCNLLALFLVGFVQDVLNAYYLRLVTEERILLATAISFVHSLTGWAVWIWFMYQFQHSAEAMTGVQAVTYSVGATFGTFLGLRKPGTKLGAMK